MMHLFIKESYMINQYLMYMAGYYDRNGKLCTLVKELNRIFMVDQSPLQILEYSINCIGFDFKGALFSSKWFLGDIKMYPVMVNPIQKICLFPIKSAKHPDTLWFNPVHIKRTVGIMRETEIEFTNSQTLRVKSRISSFNHKLQTAEQLREMTTRIGKNPRSFVLNPKLRQYKSKAKSKTKSK
jgi:competence protein ComK